LTTDEQAAVALSDLISATTGGSMTVETTVVPVSEAGTLLDRVSNGDADMCLTALDRFIDKNLAFGLFSSMPFGMSTSELEGWLHASDGADVLAILGEENDVSFHFAGDTGTKPMWSKQPLTDLASLQGLTVGSTGLGLLNLQQVGVQSVADINDPATDLGNLDVIDGMSVVAMEQNGLLGAFPNATLANPNTPSGVLTLAISNSAFAGLGETEQLLLQRACSASLALGRAKHFHDDATSMAGLGDAVKAEDMPEDIWRALSEGAQSVLTTIFEEGDVQATVVDAYVYFLTDIAAWSEIGEAAFFTGRKRISSL
jgi:TRAP-type mannitol/chloroaromatic compound transport system substrate-binding protein